MNKQDLPRQPISGRLAEGWCPDLNHGRLNGLRCAECGGTWSLHGQSMTFRPRLQAEGDPWPTYPRDIKGRFIEYEFPAEDFDLGRKSVAKEVAAAHASVAPNWRSPGSRA